PARPIFDFSRFGGQLAGFAADGVSTVELLDAGGNVIASTPVIGNVYAEADPPAGGAAVEALDVEAAGALRSLPRADAQQDRHPHRALVVGPEHADSQPVRSVDLGHDIRALSQ